MSNDLKLQLVKGAVTFNLHHQGVQDLWGPVRACFILLALQYILQNILLPFQFMWRIP